MSAEFERIVPHTPIVIVEPERSKVTAAGPNARQERERRAAKRAEDAARWKTIVEAGGRDAWIRSELAAKGLLEESNPEDLDAKERAAFKERKKAEAQERRALARAAYRAFRATHLTYLGSGVHYRDDEREKPAERSTRLERAKAYDLQQFENIEALTKGLGVDLPKLRWLAFHREVEEQSHYQLWTIPKRDGSSRTITAPKPELKRIQRWLLRNVVEKLPVHQAAHGFLAARSIVTNAAVHAGADVVVKIDVKDFFPTVTWKRVKGLLRKSGLPEGVATVCALLATEPPREVVDFRGKRLFVAKGPRALPQGAPTSPAITNALCLRLDRRMAGLARTFGCRYTRYADDLTFSFRASEGSARAPIGALLRGTRTILRAEGFEVHDKKTSVMRAGSCQRITGLVVNGVGDPQTPTARVPRDVVRRLKAAIHNRENGRPGKGTETLDQLKGMAAFVYMSDPRRGRGFLDRIEALASRGG